LIATHPTPQARLRVLIAFGILAALFWLSQPNAKARDKTGPRLRVRRLGFPDCAEDKADNGGRRQGGHGVIMQRAIKGSFEVACHHLHALAQPAIGFNQRQTMASSGARTYSVAQVLSVSPPQATMQV
jgi:hypothetical protein